MKRSIRCDLGTLFYFRAGFKVIDTECDAIHNVGRKERGIVMIKLPMSDYVSDYYKKQGIEFTFRQQAHFCWAYNDLLKDRMELVKKILEISDDEKLNAEIRERIEYEGKA